MKHIFTSRFLLPVLLLGAAPGFHAIADDAPAAAPLTLTQMRDLNVKLLDKLAPSLVWVDYYFRLDDQGRAPEFMVSYPCPNCNSSHTTPARMYIDEDRPFRVNGFAVSPDEVISPDIMLLPEWLDRIEIVAGAEKIPAELIAYYPDQQSVRLKSAQALPGIKALQFKKAAEGEKLYSFFWIDESGIPVAGVAPYAPGQVARVVETGYDTVTMPANLLVVNGEGEVVNCSMVAELPLDLMLKNPIPPEWNTVSAAERAAELTRIGKLVAANVFNVRIRLEPNDPDTQRGVQVPSDENAEVTEISAPGLLLDNGDILILSTLTPPMTARLADITLTVGDRMVEAQFTGSLKTYGALIARPSEALPGAGFKLSSDRLSLDYKKPCFGAALRSFGTQLDVMVFPERIENFSAGPKGILIPQTSNSPTILLRRDGTLMGMTLLQRDIGQRRNNEYMTPSEAIAALLRDPATGFDPANMPRPSEERKRMAWLGVEVQPLDPELARANHAALLTGDGSTGLLITNVYPDSPAAQMGLKVGEILLRIVPADTKRIIDLGGYEYNSDFFNGPFPWDQYDSVPEMYYDQIPQPWGTAKNALNQLFTQIGIGGKATLSVIENGKLVQHEMTIQQAPLTFDSAPRYSNRDVGFTLADTTFEVRNYFRMKPDDAGIVIAKVRAGGKASIAGLKPYEIITSVNDTPVHNIADFERLIAGQTELRLGIRRLAATRIVTIKLAQPEG